MITEASESCFTRAESSLVASSKRCMSMMQTSGARRHGMLAEAAIRRDLDMRLHLAGIEQRQGFNRDPLVIEHHFLWIGHAGAAEENVPLGAPLDAARINIVQRRRGRAKRPG